MNDIIGKPDYVGKSTKMYIITILCQVISTISNVARLIYDIWHNKNAK